MIRTFRSKPLRQFFETGATGKLPVRNDARVRRILWLNFQARHDLERLTRTMKAELEAILTLHAAE